VENLGAKLYYTALSLCAACVGNSSSGLLEAPSFGIPTVNIGPRQAGRIRSAHVMDVECELAAITAALTRTFDPDMKTSLKSVPNPYGNGQAAPQIVQTLATLDWSSLSVVKPFADATPH
jgi:UDP-N-acetylglucosamine 2-epimerase